ncbi:hypothetical protein HYH03_017741 [Edaphochlamys debaryana]|uniref:Protein kinase domain-containing protein n=1 Tax=Edaphochlamys debaryana TaxID=47281 RepID=A0A835XHA5_9CHLO|nr:hypothetical protein HYH03_017741 [Edaphochlamys debaryana]|eukprot:KAG2483389.1 hypothetical protein HYH03_017741 [Edaphochlamys debaryana]
MSLSREPILWLPEELRPVIGKGDSLALSDVVLRLPRCTALWDLAERECTLQVATHWPSPGLQTGAGYLYYDRLTGANSTAQRVNLTCPQSDWSALLEAAGGLAPCGTASVGSAEQLSTALQVLQPTHARLMITLTANISLPAAPDASMAAGPGGLLPPAPPLFHLTRNTTITGTAGPAATELDLGLQIGAFDLLTARQRGEGSPVLVLTDMCLANIPQIRDDDGFLTSKSQLGDCFIGLNTSGAPSLRTVSRPLRYAIGSLQDLVGAPLPPGNVALATNASVLRALAQDGVPLSYNLTLVGPAVGPPVTLRLEGGVQLFRTPGGDTPAAGLAAARLARLDIAGVLTAAALAAPPRSLPSAAAAAAAPAADAGLVSALAATPALASWRDRCLIGGQVSTRVPLEVRACTLWAPSELLALLVRLQDPASSPAAGTPLGDLLRMWAGASGQVNVSAAPAAVQFVNASLLPGPLALLGCTAVPEDEAAAEASTADCSPVSLATAAAAPPPAQGSTTPTAAIVGGAVGGAVALTLLVAAAAVVVVRRRRGRARQLKGSGGGGKDSAGASVVNQQSSQSHGSHEQRDTSASLKAAAMPAALNDSARAVEAIAAGIMAISIGISAGTQEGAGSVPAFMGTCLWQPTSGANNPAGPPCLVSSEPFSMRPPVQQQAPALAPAAVASGGGGGGRRGQIQDVMVAEIGQMLESVKAAAATRARAAGAPSEEAPPRVNILGRGGYGVVYLGNWRGLPAAVKVIALHAGDSAARRQRLAREVALTMALSHPNGGQGSGDVHQGVVEPEADVQLRVVMQYCDGGSLRQALESGQLGPPPPDWPAPAPSQGVGAAGAAMAAEAELAEGEAALVEARSGGAVEAGVRGEAELAEAGGGGGGGGGYQPGAMEGAGGQQEGTGGEVGLRCGQPFGGGAAGSGGSPRAAEEGAGAAPTSPHVKIEARPPPPAAASLPRLLRPLVAARGVLRGLSFLHSQGVIHGDLTDANVLLKAVVPHLPPPAAAITGSAACSPVGSPAASAHAVAWVAGATTAGSSAPASAASSGSGSGSGGGRGAGRRSAGSSNASGGRTRQQGALLTSVRAIPEAAVLEEPEESPAADTAGQQFHTASAGAAVSGPSSCGSFSAAAGGSGCAGLSTENDTCGAAALATTISASLASSQGLQPPVRQDETAEGEAAEQEPGTVRSKDLETAAEGLLSYTFKLADFGLSAQLQGHSQSHVSNVGIAQGTPFFVAPELLSCPRLTTACDMYRKVRHLFPHKPYLPAAPSLLCHASPLLPPALAALLRRCLSLAPGERPSALEALRCVEEAVRDVAGPALARLLLEAELWEAVVAPGARVGPQQAPAALP